MLRRLLIDDRVLRPDQLSLSPLVKDADLHRAHAPTYVTAIDSGVIDAAAMRRIGFPWSPHIAARARATMGGAVAAAQTALQTGISGQLAGGTHHAHYDFGSGYCVFNDFAVAALSLLANELATRVAIIDLDVHQGDGNASILSPREDVFVLSVHGEKNFPFRKCSSDLDIALPDGVEDAAYLSALEDALDAIWAFNPDIILYQAGVDPLKEDKLGRMALTHDGLMKRDRLVLTASKQRSIPVSMAIGGGYADPIDASVAAYANTYRTAKEIWGNSVVFLMVMEIFDPSFWSFIWDATRYESLVTELGPWAPLLSIGAMVIVSFLPLPAETIAIANGMAFGRWMGFVWTWIGALIAAMLAFALARSLGAPLVRRFIPAAMLEKFETLATRRGAPFLLFVRMIPLIPYTVVNYGSGLSPIRFRTYLWTSALGMAPPIFAFVSAGALMKDQPWTGVWAGVRPESPRVPVMGTSVIVIGNEGVLLFDAGGAPLQSVRVLEKVRALTDKPVTHVVISHWHGDHHLGVYRILDDYPDAELVSHAFTAAAMAGAPMDYIKPQQADGFIGPKEALKRYIDAGELPDGTPLSNALRAYFQRAYEDADLIDAQMRAFQVTQPTKIFEDSLTIDLGGRAVELRHIGWGNTKGDVVLWLPEEKIVATGDIVVLPTPYGFGSYPKRWVDTLQQVKALGYETLIPGHGPLQTDTAYVDLLIETMTLIYSQVEPLVANGLSLEEVREQMDFSSVEERFIGGDQLLISRFQNWFKTPIVQAAFNNASGIENEKLERETEAEE
ncbi:Uncharacterized protein SYNPCC7002_A1628 [Durusdinium trenchii]|uniref:Uncharacterized protein SYNPCC7002_A1628 n=1 Tax=Durusdinium trenchii TaxID=1381693 RepID=A0ABP0LTP7_9DINO